jgi:photosystem II stability/assembly factor-like uncharacterized protein
LYNAGYVSCRFLWRRSIMRRFFTVVLLFMAAVSSRAEIWTALGPPGGDVRAMAVDPARPSRVFLGTADGHIFGSEDSGAHWTLVGRASSRLDAVITAIVVDPRDGNVLFAASWTRDSAAGGGVFRSADGGHTWTGASLAGQAVRALAMAASDPRVLVAGTLDGVYRSLDAGKSWERISPEHHQELRNFDSLAIDPGDPQTIYAGTFHLPWKTTDGGRTWRPIHEGMIDDSDVMSLLIDEGNSQRVYASACSGIYRSEDRAAQWRKIQGIPYTARRTYAITQDPKRPASVYAATSEGLWKTDDGGMTWRRTTPESWVVNTVVVAEGHPGRVLIGTEELGVLASSDGGEHFEDANAGFEHRQILALGVNANQAGRVLAVLAHAPEPILATEDNGRKWSALGPGLRAEQALRVYAAPDDAWWVSLAHGGLMRYDAGKKAWQRAGKVLGEVADAKAAVSPHGGGAGGHPPQRIGLLQPTQVSGKSTRKAMNGPQPLLDIVTDMAFSSKEWYAATSRGLLLSADRGATWRLTPIGPLTSLPVQSVRVSSNGQRIRVVSLRGLVFSDDGGNSWTWHDLPLDSGGAVTLDAVPGDENTLVAMARNGLYISRDAGTTWQQAASGLPSTPVRDFVATGGLFVASMRTGGLYVSSDSGRTWDRVPGPLADGFFAVVARSNEPGVVFAASATDGLYRVEWPGSTPSRAASRNRSQKETDVEVASPSN